MEDERRREGMAIAAGMMDLMTEILEELQVDWWIRKGWSLRRLQQGELRGEVDDKQENGEELRGRGQELRGSDGAAGGERAAGSDAERQVRAFVKATLKQKPQAKARRRRRSRR